MLNRFDFGMTFQIYPATRSAGSFALGGNLELENKRTLFFDLDEMIAALQPEWLIGVGDFAVGRIRDNFDEGTVKLGKILHPSPACPASNKDWPGTVTAQLVQMGVWS